jgi:phenylalanyl-tRNA synthetase beta chain
MKLSLDWIKDYVEIPDDLELTRIAYDLTMSTVEVEDMINLGKGFNNIVVGLVKEVLPHPHADKLKICKTDIGGGDIRGIVCGGSNLKAGMKVAVACPGAMVHWHGADKLVEIKETKVRDVESSGMICASSEIGLFDLFPFTLESTIIDLSEFAAPAGTSLAKALDLDDVILEIDNKSLTNRPDLWGHYGIAREIAALYYLPLEKLVPFNQPSMPDLKIIVSDTSRCPRYTGIKIEGLSIKPSPFKIQSRIWRVGMRPINAIVDITNYVMLATGQPTHAFDSDNIKGHITVRRARDAEKILLLNGRELSLSPDDLVIADEESSIGLAGVMGGEKDSVLPETKNVILEIANFDSIGVRRTATRHDIRTEASSRYEKAIDPERGDIALSLAMRMFAHFFPNMSVTGFCDIYPEKLKRSEIDVSLEWLERRLGRHIPESDISNILEHLGFNIVIKGNMMRAIAPTWRSTGDISIPNDIIEEIARMYGFENFKPMPITTTFEGAINQPEIDIDRKLREYLAFRCGMQEIITYPWISEEYVNAVFPDKDGMLSISTPPSPDEHYIRSSLLPSLCKAAADNLRFFSEFAIFESAQVFFDRDFSAFFDSRELLPPQRRNIAGAYVGDYENMHLLFRRTKGIVELLPRYIHTEPIAFEKIKKPVWSDNTVWLNIIHCGEAIGNLALLSKKAALDCGIKNSAVMIFELDIDSLKPYPSRTNKFAQIPEYPMTEYDISILVDSPVKWEEISESVFGRTESDNLLRRVSFVNEYKGNNIPDGKKSITLRLLIGSLKKTLTSEEIENCANKVIRCLQNNLGAELRS